MARLNKRPSSAAGPDDEDVRQLDQARNKNDQKLKSRFERIFRKYEHNFEGVGDEIDIHSGEIVVDNGHLQNMRDEADPGKSASSIFVRGFQEELEHEDEDDGEDESSSGDGSGSGEDEEGSASDGDDDNDGDSQSMMDPFRALARPPPRLAQLLVRGEGTADIANDHNAENQSTTEDESGTATPAGLLGQVPALQESMSALTGRSRRREVDDHTIQALGTTIANQLAQLMAGSSKKRSKKSRTKARRNTTEPAWDYPDIEMNRQKRKRSSSPVVAPPISSPPVVSPGQRSLWAPEGPRPPKRSKQSATPAVRRLRSSIIPSSAVRGADLKRCMNCSFTNSPAWHVGPDGGDLCVSCGRYYDHHGRMKPFDSPTPSIEDQDSSPGATPGMDLEEPIVLPDSGTDENTVSGHLHAVEIDAVPPQRHMSSNVLVPQSAPEPASVRPLEAHAESLPVPMPVEPESMHPPSPTREPSLEIIMDQSVGRNAAPSVDPKPEEDMPDTPESYPANTSRPMASPVRQHNWYSAEEDALIIKLKEQEKLPWHLIARRLPRRSQFALQNRYTRVLHNTDCPGRDLFNAERTSQQAESSTPDRSAWSFERDQILLGLRDIQKLGWPEIASVMPGHSAEAVESRYAELRQAIDIKREEESARKHCQWSPSEDALIVRLKEVDNLAWHQIADKFDDRSLQSVQKRYSRWLTPEKRQRAPSDPTKGTLEELILEADPALAVTLTPGREAVKPFEPAEDELLKKMADREGGFDWGQVSSQFTQRSARSVYLRFLHLYNVKPETVTPNPVASATNESRNMQLRSHSPSVRRTDEPPLFDSVQSQSSAAQEGRPNVAENLGPGSRKPFERFEDDLIMQLKASHNASWDEISLRLPGRSVKAISHRFTELLTAMHKSQLATKAAVSPGFRSPADSQVRSTSSAPRPDLRPFTSEEDNTISQFRAEGMSWDDMASRLQNRTPASLADHWHAKLQPKARKSLPAPVNARAGLLRQALDNSRRRSESHHGIVDNGLGPRHGRGEGNFNDPVTFDDEVDTSAASEQLIGEWRSSGVQQPSPPSTEQVFQKLVLAAEKFARQRSNPHIVGQVKNIYQSRIDNPPLQKLLELLTSDISHTTSEVEWAFEAFEHANKPPVTNAEGVDESRQPSSTIAQTSNAGKGKGKGKSKAREHERTLPAHYTSTTGQPLQPSLKSSLHHLAPSKTPVNSNANLRSAQTQKDNDSQVHSPLNAVSSENTMSVIDEATLHSNSDAVRLETDDTTADTHIQEISFDTSAIDTGPPASSFSAGSSAGAVSMQAREHGTGDETETLQASPGSDSEQSLGSPARPNYSYSELIRMALDATQSKAMHPKTICTWVETNFEFYRHASPSWKAAILAELHQNDQFEQCGAGRARPWRIKAAAELQSSQARLEDKRSLRKSGQSAAAVRARLEDRHIVPCSDSDVDDDKEATDETIVVTQPIKKRVHTRGKRTTDSVEDLQDYTPVKAAVRPAIVEKMPSRSKPRNMPKVAEGKLPASAVSAPAIDLTLEIADSDGADEFSSTPAQDPPAQKSPPQRASSGKTVRFADTVEVRGPASVTADHSTPSLKRPARDYQESETREPENEPSSSITTGPTSTTTAKNAKPAVPSSSPVFMKPAARRSSDPGNKSNAISTPLPRAKSRLSQLRRESTGTAQSPRTPKTNWPKRHSTPTAIFSHRASPALGRGVMLDRFGFGRKRVVETPVRELAERVDLDEDELA